MDLSGMAVQPDAEPVEASADSAHENAVERHSKRLDRVSRSLPSFRVQRGISGCSNWSRLNDDDADQAEDKTARGAATGNFNELSLAWLLLPAIPVGLGLRGNLMSLAASSAHFSSFTPTCGSAALIGVSQLIMLVKCFPKKEIMALVDRKYALMAMPAMFHMADRGLWNYALKTASPSLVAVAVKSAILVFVPLQYLAFRTVPDKSQLALLPAIPIAIAMCMWESLQDGHLDYPLLAALGAGIFIAVADVSIEFTVKRLRLQTPEGASYRAETLRAFIWLETFRVSFGIAMALAIENDFVQCNGLMGGWSWIMVLQAVVPSAVATCINNYAMIKFDALVAGVFASLEIVVAYLLELVLLPSVRFSWAAVLRMALLTLVVMAYALVSKDTRDAATRGRVAALADIENKASRIRPSLGAESV